MMVFMVSHNKLYLYILKQTKKYYQTVYKHICDVKRKERENFMCFKRENKSRNEENKPSKSWYQRIKELYEYNIILLTC